MAQQQQLKQVQALELQGQQVPQELQGPLVLLVQQVQLAQQGLQGQLVQQVLQVQLELLEQRELQVLLGLQQAQLEQQGP